MADYTALVEAGSALIELLRDNLTPEPVDNRETIALCSPHESENNQLTVYLYHVEEEARNLTSGYYYVKINEDWSEIFGVDTEKGEYDPETFKELLVAAVLDAKNRKGRFMTFFCEEEYEQAAVECGFSRIGNYLCYKMHLEEN